MTTSRSRHLPALLGLLLANLLWGLSFPTIKALIFEHQRRLPESSSWFVTAMTVAPRFLLAAAALLLVARKRLRQMTLLEQGQGALLGLAVAGGMLLQTDGLQFTSASVSAFLTQFYALMIPLVVAVRTRRAPPAAVWLSSVLVLAGVAILARFDPRAMHLGRGELETLASSVFFMGQIFLLGDRRFSANRVLPVTFVMFATQGAIFSVMALLSAPRPDAVLVPWMSPMWSGATILLAGFCTLGAFTLMNRWQPEITATEAGVIYCFEPVFASLMALFLPAVFSRWGGFNYANEHLTWQLLAGGGLITLANFLLQLQPPAKPA